jgi:hypothetical protein
VGSNNLNTTMEPLPFGVTALDPATYTHVVASMILVAAAALAGYSPARRATRVDPMRARPGTGTEHSIVGRLDAFEHRVPAVLQSGSKPCAACYRWHASCV